MKDEDLLGYLIGGLDPEECGSVEAHLQVSPETLVRLEQLRLSLLPLEAAREIGLPPHGLAERTIARLESHLAALEAIAKHPSEVATRSAPGIAEIDQPLNPAAMRDA